MLYSLSRYGLLLAAVFMSWLSFGAQAQPTLQQFKAWLICYGNNDICADYNYDGVLTPRDFSAFLTNYDTPPGTDGWTQLAPSAESVVIYVSSAMGNDSNDGRSVGRPVKTIARAYALISPSIARLEGTPLRSNERPKLVISGEQDRLIQSPQLQPVLESFAQPFCSEFIPGADHYWLGREDEMAGRVSRFFSEYLA